MSYTTFFTRDGARRVTRRNKTDDASPETVYNRQDFTYNQRNQVTQISNTVAGGLGTADATRSCGYAGDGPMISLTDGTASPSSLAWHGGRLAYEVNGTDKALYRWSSVGLVEFVPAVAANRAYPSVDQWGHTTRVTGMELQNQYWSNVAGQVIASQEQIGSTPPSRNRVVSGPGWLRLGTASEQVDVDVDGQVFLPDPYVLCQEKPGDVPKVNKKKETPQEAYERKKREKEKALEKEQEGVQVPGPFEKFDPRTNPSKKEWDDDYSLTQEERRRRIDRYKDVAADMLNKYYWHLEDLGLVPRGTTPGNPTTPPPPPRKPAVPCKLALDCDFKKSEKSLAAGFTLNVECTATIGPAGYALGPGEVTIDKIELVHGAGETNPDNLLDGSRSKKLGLTVVQDAPGIGQCTASWPQPVQELEGLEFQNPQNKIRVHAVVRHKGCAPETTEKTKSVPL